MLAFRLYSNFETELGFYRALLGRCLEDCTRKEEILKQIHVLKEILASLNDQFVQLDLNQKQQLLTSF